MGVTIFVMFFRYLTIELDMFAMSKRAAAGATEAIAATAMDARVLRDALRRPLRPRLGPTGSGAQGAPWRHPHGGIAAARGGAANGYEIMQEVSVAATASGAEPRLGVPGAPQLEDEV